MKNLNNGTIDVITKKELCEKLHINPVTVWNWQNKGWLKPISLGRKIFYKKSDINDLLERGYSNSKGGNSNG